MENTWASTRHIRRRESKSGKMCCHLDDWRNTINFLGFFSLDDWACIKTPEHKLSQKYRAPTKKIDTHWTTQTHNNSRCMPCQSAIVYSLWCCGSIIKCCPFRCPYTGHSLSWDGTQTAPNSHWGWGTSPGPHAFFNGSNWSWHTVSD